MKLSFGKYTITGTVDEIREFLQKEEPKSNITAIIKDTYDDSLPAVDVVQCPKCGSKNVTLSDISGTSSNGNTHICRVFYCEDCGKPFVLTTE